VVEVGLITPPVGMNLFIINQVARDVPIAQTYRGVLPFVASDLIRVVILVSFPAITLWLVGVIFAGGALGVAASRACAPPCFEPNFKIEDSHRCFWVIGPNIGSIKGITCWKPIPSERGLRRDLRRDVQQWLGSFGKARASSLGTAGYREQSLINL